MVSTKTVREALAEWFREQSQFRQRKAEQYPLDTRNADSAAALEQVAVYVLSLPDADPQLRKLSKSAALLFAEGVFSSPKVHELDSFSSEREALRCGFDGSIDPAEWFADWVNTVIEEAAELQAALESSDA